VSARAILTLLSGGGVALAVPLLLSPILSRAYTPSDFGDAALYIGLASSISTLATGRYESAVLLPRRNSHALHIVYLTAGLIIAVSIICGFALIAMGGFIGMPNIYYTLPLAVLLISLLALLDRHNNRLKNYRVMSAQRIVRVAVDGAVAVALGLLFKLDIGLVVALISGYTVSSILMLSVFYAADRANRAPISLQRIVVQARRYRAFPVYNMPHAFINSLSASFPVLLLPLFFPDSVVGLYAFGFRIVQAPLSLLSSAVGNVVSQQLAEAYASGGCVYHIFRRYLVRLALLSLALPPILFFGKEIFSLVFGPDWALAGEYMKILTPFLMLNFLSATFAMLPALYNRQRTALKIEIVFAAVKAAGILIGGYFGSVTMALGFLSGGSCIVILSYLFWLNRLASSPRDPAIHVPC
jgi:O-antigen/teichoic acid export membrane protein